ncbi:MAG: response regulator [Desulfobacteraceae bacterium]|nr:response regulator [Desulfobacteraceae bacterium]
MNSPPNRMLLKILLMTGDSGLETQITDTLRGVQELRCRTLTVQSLSEGIEAFIGWPFDAILLDLHLPDCTGLDTFTRMQAAAPGLPIIVFDCGQDPDLVPQTARQGAMGVVSKGHVDGARLARTLQFAVERNRRQKAIAHREQKFRVLIENLKDAYYEIDFRGNFTYVNNTVLQHLGRTREQLIGMNNREYNPPDVAKRMYEVFSEVYRTGVGGKVVDNTLIRPDGTIVEVEVRITLHRDDHGNPVCFGGISREVTDKIEAQRALARSEEKYRTILENMEDSYFETDLKGRMTFFNAATGSVFGYTMEELASSDNRTYMDPESAKIVLQAYRRIYETGQPNRALQYQIVSKDGQHRYIESSVSLIRDSQGRAAGFRGITRDITERKAVELELAKAKEKAEAATKAKSEFLANMSHEIRTPMNGIIGMYNLLHGTALSVEQADFVKTGKESADRLLSVINDILDFSKMEAGKLDIENIDFDLRKTIDDLVMAPARQAHDKGLELVFKIDHEVPSLLMGDPGRLRQAVMNLLSNAIKFTQKGEVALFVSLEKEGEQQVALRFAVQDTGIGISKSDQKRLFRSFQQVDNSTTRRYGGTGLGLAITKRLADLMQGRMGMHSDVDKGSLFWFTAVFEKAAVAAQTPVVVPEAVRAKRILIVDDSKTNLDILEGYLKQWGCGCDRATSGVMALTLMQAVSKSGAPYDLVISDMLMPKMDGAELGRRIKADAALKGAILVMLTSQGLRGDAAEMKRIGFAAYLTKPVRPSQLYECLVTVLSRATQGYEQQKPQIITSYSLSEAKRRNVRILLAEDNTINQKLALHLLGRFGFVTEAVPNGLEALNALSQKDYDLVLMDIQMPEMDGLEATRLIREQSSSVRNHHVPVVAMTAQASREDRDHCLKIGMNDYIAKPIHPEELLRVVEKMIGEKKGA